MTLLHRMGLLMGRPPRQPRRLGTSVGILLLALASTAWRSSGPPLRTARSQQPAVTADQPLSCPCSILPLKAAPLVSDAGPDNAVELGVKFSSDVPGFIQGIRFFKSKQNTGPHSGRLWTLDGALLSEVTFTGESASGWQSAAFPKPVRIEAGTTYIASYHTESGHYAFTSGYFVRREMTRGPLRVLGGINSANGVFRYGGGPQFPNQSLNVAANYWVDISFVPADDTEDGAPAGEPGQVILVDSTNADFSRGVLNTAMVTASGGELVLAPALSGDFSGTVLPAGWQQSRWSREGSMQFRNGAAKVDGVSVGAETAFTQGRSLEFEATFTPTMNQHVGFAASLSDGPWALFSTFTGGRLFARTSQGDAVLDTRLAADALNHPHRFRIDWQDQSVVFSIDGTPVATHRVSIGREMRVLGSDLRADSSVLTVAWMRVSPHAPQGTFTSRVFDAGETTRWTTPAWNGEEPAGTRVEVTVRTGETAEPDATWTPFAALPASGSTVLSRYLQYRLELHTTDPAATPVVREVRVNGTRATVAWR